MNTDEAKEGDLRVWNIINPPNPPNHHHVISPEEGAKLIERLANAQLRMSSIHSNAFGLEVFENGEWLEWYSEDGQDIDEYAETLSNPPTP